MHLRLFLLISFLAFTGLGFGQTQRIKFNLVNGMNGIALGKINSIVQDKNGYMWFSDQSNRCITRYDGNRMIRYTSDPKDTNTLGGPYPECIAVDSNGILWIGFFGYGVDRFDPATNTFTHFRYDPKREGSLASDTVSNILVDHLNQVWIGTSNGLDLLDPASGTFTHYQHKASEPSSLSYNFVRALYEDRQGTIWVGTGFAWEANDLGGLNKLDRSTGSFTRFLHDPNNENSLVSNKVRAIFEDSRGTLWIGTKGDGLHSLDRNSGIIQRHPYDPDRPEMISRPALNATDDHITFITEDAEHCLWIGTLSNGLLMYNPVLKTSTHYYGSLNAESGFKDRNSWTAFAAKDAWLWISTQDNNLYKVDLYGSRIDFNDISAFVSNALLDEGRHVEWVATTDGLKRIDLNTGKVILYQHDPNRPGSISSNNVTHVHQTSDGTIWATCYNAGLNRWDEKTQSFTHFRNDPNDSLSLAWNDVSDLVIDGQSNFWVGTYGGGLHLMDVKTGKFQRFQYSDKDSTSLSGDIVTDIQEGDHQDLWIGTWEFHGISRMDIPSRTFKRYLPGTSIVAILKSSKGDIYACSENNLYQYDAAKDAFVLYTISGVPIISASITSFAIASCVLDRSDHIWLFSASGIAQIKPESQQCILFDKQRGFLTQYLPYNSSDTQTNGLITLGTFEGLYTFDPHKLIIPKGRPNLVITGLQINGQWIQPGEAKILPKAINDTKELHLAYDQNIFSLMINNIDFSLPENKLTLCKLEPYDKDWKPIDLNSPVYYFNIQPGTYVLSVKSFNTRFGTFAEKQITIIISPPWWKSWWAYTLYAIAILGMAYFIHRSLRAQVIRQERDRNRAHELAQAKEIEKAYHDLKNTQAQLIQAEKMASLGELTAGIAHEIQNPLNFVNNFSEVSRELLDEMKDELDKGHWPEAKTIATDLQQNLEKITYHGKRADGIVKGMLQHSRASSGVKEPTDINALCDEYLRLAYHGLRARDKTFNATMQTHLDASIGKVNVIPQDIGRVLLNLITNAFHAVSLSKTSKGDGPYIPSVTVSTQKKLTSTVQGNATQPVNWIEIAVSDNGPGIPEAIKEKIFQPFFTTKPTGQGTGLGLSLSYDIVKAHGGELKVETKEGEGSVFTIRLPIT